MHFALFSKIFRLKHPKKENYLEIFIYRNSTVVGLGPIHIFAKCKVQNAKRKVTNAKCKMLKNTLKNCKMTILHFALLFCTFLFIKNKNIDWEKTYAVLVKNAIDNISYMKKSFFRNFGTLEVWPNFAFCTYFCIKSWAYALLS